MKNCRGQLAPKHLFKSLNTVSIKHFRFFKSDFLIQGLYVAKSVYFFFLLF